tara:strand:- start:152 stop:433 length:282 start_codon:yes stop_codon:yes gene_type:complete
MDYNKSPRELLEVPKTKLMISVMNGLGWKELHLHNLKPYRLLHLHNPKLHRLLHLHNPKLHRQLWRRQVLQLFLTLPQLHLLKHHLLRQLQLY